MNDFGIDVRSCVATISDALTLTGSDFLREFCQIVQSMFGARSTMVGSLRVVEAEHFFFEAHVSNLVDFPFEDFDGCRTPCHDVLIQNNVICVLDDAAQKYPDAQIVQAFKSRAYIGCPLVNKKGSTIGVFALEWPDAITEQFASKVQSVLLPYLTRVAEELRRESTSQAIEKMITTVDPTRNNNTEIFRTIVKQAAQLSGIHTVILTKSCDDGPSSFKVLAANSNGVNVAELEGTSIRYAGTPCQNMLERNLYFKGRGLTSEFSEPPLLEDLGAEAYLGFGFRNSDDETIGHLAFIHNRPMAPRAANCQLMKMISSRAGQELQRYDLELERNAMESALRVRSKLESLGIMAGTIAHDFNNQLTAMIGNTELALLEVPETYPAFEFLRTAEESMWRARDVIGELMDFAGNDSTVVFEPVALGEVIASTLNEFRPRLQRHNEVRASVAENLPNIMGRRVHFIQIFSNLVANGLDALKADEPHSISIDARMISQADVDHERCLTGQCVHLPERCVVLEVSDTGYGMDKATAERIFDPYFSTKGVSRGLGLSSVLGLAKRFGIGLTLESDLDRGTVFRLYFGNLEKTHASPPGESTAKTDGVHRLTSRRTVLVVDDEISVQNMVVKLLERAGHEVHSASSGEEALTVAKTMSCVDLVIIDVVMPGMNGFETVAELRKFQPALPAVLISGFSERSVSESFRPDEITKFLVKPFSVQDLRGAVATLVV